VHIFTSFLVARKTKCDGAHPACASCARRSLPCSYIHDSAIPSTPGPKKGRRASSSKPTAESAHSLSPPSSRMVPTPSTGNDVYEQGESHMQGELDLKRSLDYQDVSRASKRMRMENIPAAAGIP
jgi:hypothetical protein